MYNEYGFYPDTKPLTRNDKAPTAGNYAYFFIKPKTNDWREMEQLEKEAGKHGAVLALPTRKGVLISIANSDDQHFRNVYKDLETEDITKNVGDIQSKYFNASIEYVLNNLNIDETRNLMFEMNINHLDYNEEEVREFRRKQFERDLQLKLKQQQEQDREDRLTTKAVINTIDYKEHDYKGTLLKLDFIDVTDSNKDPHVEIGINTFDDQKLAQFRFSQEDTERIKAGDKEILKALDQEIDKIPNIESSLGINIKQNNEDKSTIHEAMGFSSFNEVLQQYPNAIDLSNSEKKKWSYQEVEQYLKTIVNNSYVTLDGNNVAISDNYEHIETSSEYKKLNRRGKEEIKTYAAEIEKLITNSEYEKEIPNKDSAKKDIEKFKYYYVPVWINNRAYNVLLECGVLKENEPSEMQACKEASNEHITESSTNKYIRKNGRLQVADISYLYNLRNRPLFKKIEEKQKIIEEKDKELNIWTAKAEKDDQTIIKLQDELDQKNRLLYGKTELEINGTKRIFSEGLFNGIKKAITRLDEANEKIKKLNFINRNQNINKQNISQQTRSDDSDMTY